MKMTKTTLVGPFWRRRLFDPFWPETVSGLDDIDRTVVSPCSGLCRIRHGHGLDAILENP